MKSIGIITTTTVLGTIIGGILCGDSSGSSHVIDSKGIAVMFGTMLGASAGAFLGIGTAVAVETVDWMTDTFFTDNQQDNCVNTESHI